jgi:hypothetical protein
MRNQELFYCEPGKAEISLGKGQQGWAANGPGGFYLAWLGGRSGPVWALTPGSTNPVKLSEQGGYPVIAGPLNCAGPIVVAWEDDKNGDRLILTAVLAVGK